MIIDVSDITRVNGASMKLEFEEAPVYKEPVEGCFFEEPVSFKGTLVNMNGILELDGRLKGKYKTSCYRCLREVSGTIDIAVKESYVNDSKYADEIDAYNFEGKFLDPAKALEDNVILNLPMKQVCSQKCKGLCQVCGKDLNEAECGCRTDNVNPQFQALDKFFE